MSLYDFTIAFTPDEPRQYQFGGPKYRAMLERQEPITNVQLRTNKKGAFVVYVYIPTVDPQPNDWQIRAFWYLRSVGQGGTVQCEIVEGVNAICHRS